MSGSSSTWRIRGLTVFPFQHSLGQKKRKLLDRDPGGGNAANGAERDAADVFRNRVTRKKQSRPENEFCQNQCRRTTKQIHPEKNHRAVSRKQSVERDFGPVICN